MMLMARMICSSALPHFAQAMTQRKKHDAVAVLLILLDSGDDDALVVDSRCLVLLAMPTGALRLDPTTCRDRKREKEEKE